ncbi:MAG: hypothetical protein IKK74_01045 [Clostridia bacterium]|nr:hypothetical protein [Clostridia bacterium]
MKRLIALIMTLCLLLSFSSCAEERTDIDDYQYMYDGIFKDWKKHTDTYEGQENLLGFGEYLYNSELILFPRETPSTLKEFYYHWTPMMDVDGYAIYFTCELDANNYSAFTEGLSNFEVQTGTESLKPIYDTEHFSLPTYILQWHEVGKKWEVLEYIMLDEANRTAVFVYTMNELEFIEEHSSYTFTPTEMHFLNGNFSIYNYIETDVYFENCTYDNSFLEYLK